MNNLEMECFEVIADLLNNRPKDINGNTVKYGSHDKREYTRLINEMKDSVEKSKSKITADCYTLLMKIYDTVLECIDKI